jgi:enoyl-CoA hydratase/carnithine racemase
MSVVQFHEYPTKDGFKLLEISLNSEKSLNALTLEMIQLIEPKLSQAADDVSIKAVLLTGSGEKAFCAGGDVVSLYRSITSGDNPSFPTEYFTHEYRLDYTIHTYPKPIICWGSGIVMGGGMGLMNGCSHRIVTETSHMAMPEVTIGLFPDVGGSFFLNKMPGRTGLFLGLTGSPVFAADALFLGLADRFVESTRYAELVTDLQSADWNGDSVQTVNQTLRQLEQQSKPAFRKDSPIQDHYDFIQSVTDQDDLSQLMQAMAKIESDDSWIQRSQKSITHGSPLSVHLIAEQLKRARHLSLKEVFMSELVLAVQCCQHSEFPEGVRALLVDKDRNPNWMFKSVECVDEAVVQRFFESPWSENPLAGI